ncbi:MAG TPA: PilZ domain-containing protein [Candidatus Hydrogenedens sp.]|nr:PilZ domain-containing protein [Candidatus Hydrogenedens sp.]HOL20188.1 PilZ domain-containing protein [Candidatus Hydrogenedens sp.]
MDRTKEIEYVLREALKTGTVGVISIEGKLCPVTVISVTSDYIRVTRTNLADGLFSGMQVALELCSNRGCLVLQTEIIEVPESADEGIVLAIPKNTLNIYLRRFWRISVDIPAEVKPHAHPRKIKAIIRNISAGGMLITIEETLEIGESVDVFFTLKYSAIEKEKTFCLVGSVTHVSFSGKENQVSLKFVGMDPEDEKQINEFVIKTLRTTCPKLEV